MFEGSAKYTALANFKFALILTMASKKQLLFMRKSTRKFGCTTHDCDFYCFKGLG